MDNDNMDSDRAPSQTEDEQPLRETSFPEAV